MTVKNEIHPLVLSQWESFNFAQEGKSHLKAIGDVQNSYRSGNLTKPVATDRILDHFFQIDKVTYQGPLRSLTEQKVGDKFNADVIFPGETTRRSPELLLFNGGRRIASSVARRNFVCAVFNPDIGIAIASEDSFTPQTMREGIEIVLDWFHFDIADKMFGTDQLPTHNWISPTQLRWVIDETTAQAFNEFYRLPGSDQITAGQIGVYAFGLEYWQDITSNGQTVADWFRDCLSQRTDLAALGINVSEIDTPHLPGVTGIVYGGKMDNQIVVPKYFQIR